MQKATKAVALALSLVGCAAMMTSCSLFGAKGDDTDKSIDWSTLSYPDYDTLYADETAPEGTEGYWDYWETKTVSYQFINDKTGAENHGFASVFPLLINLYEDGSIKGWEKGSFIPSMFDPMEGSTEEQNEYNSTYKLLELFYGYWEQSGSTVTIYVQSSRDYASDGDSVVYSKYSFDTTPSESNTISFYFNATESGQAIKSLVTCNLNYVNTVQYTKYANFASTPANLDGVKK